MNIEEFMRIMQALNPQCKVFVEDKGQVKVVTLFRIDNGKVENSIIISCYEKYIYEELARLSEIQNNISNIISFIKNSLNTLTPVNPDPKPDKPNHLKIIN